MNVPKQPPREESGQAPEAPSQSATRRGTNIPLDLEAARQAAGRGPDGAGPYRARKRPPYSIMD